MENRKENEQAKKTSIVLSLLIDGAMEKRICGRDKLYLAKPYPPDGLPDAVLKLTKTFVQDGRFFYLEPKEREAGYERV